LIVHPDTTSGGSYRQNEHAGNTAMPTNRSGHRRRSIHEPKINRLLYESPGLGAGPPLLVTLMLEVLASTTWEAR
jgi:hypothetical protein